MFHLPEINFEQIPFLSEETVEYHFSRHHKKYIDNLNSLIKGTDDSHKTIEELMESNNPSIRNNACQAWNHTFYWLGLNSEASSTKREPFSTSFAQNVKVGQQEEDFKNAALNLLGSGWVWLVKNLRNDKVEIISTSNADTPPLSIYRPLLVCDVWEHAYYIDYRNGRSKYVSDFWRAVKWKFVEANYNSKNMDSIGNLMTETQMTEKLHAS